MSDYTRRHLLTRIAPALALATLLPACGQPVAPPTTTRPRQRAVPPVGTPSPATVATPSPVTIARSPVIATPIAPTPTPTLSSTSPAFSGDAGCPIYFPRDPQPGDPYSLHLAAERKAFAFAEKVRQLADLIVLGTVRDILPARWVTLDGHRPANPHSFGRLLIITPVRVEVEQVAKGAYSLPDIYFAASGGRIGQDCASYQGSGAWPEFRFGGRFLYFVNAFTPAIPPPVPVDTKYRYYRADYSYTVKPDSTITIGPEWDIMGGRVDDPPRTLTMDEALREIAVLLATPSTTPTR